MIEALQFVKGAVARKDFVPILEHFRIQDGRIFGYNGTIALSSPIELDLACSPKAAPFIKAVGTCEGTVQLHVTPNGKLAIKSGSFSAFVDCCQDEFPPVAPEGTSFELQVNSNLLEALKVLVPFVAEDASRPWARGILFRQQSAFATNNIVLIEKWHGRTFPVELNIPVEAVAELLRIGEEPIKLQVSENSATFHYPGGRWLRTQLSSNVWPDLTHIFTCDKATEMAPPPPGLFKALEALAPFVDELNRAFLLGDRVATSQSEDAGASVQVPGVPATGCYNLDQLRQLEKVIKAIDFGQYPSPAPFEGESLRGIIVGMIA